ncbi:MAG: MmgE/PrpD family protein [Burkholderiales bacterium]|nr:MmgE/PrpD family protein [Burkholderiales bacterium]
MTLAGELASRIAATSFEQLTPLALRYAKMGLMDTLAVGIAGSSDAATVIAGRVIDKPAGGSLLWGTGARASALDAAFVNGIAANVLDFDDCTDNLGGHPSAPILPALIALAEERDASGKDLLAAYVAGFETETCLGRGVNYHHYEKGWHPTATLGVFGAGAACARLMALDAKRIAHVLALCASMAAGLKSNLGSMAKPLHVGHCSRSGLLAARLAAEGFTGNVDALERHQGFLEVFNGAGNYRIDRILEKWGAPWEIEMPGIAIKQHPCCLSTQAAVDAMLGIVRAAALRPCEVARIEARISARRLEHTDRPEPRSALDAKLSAQYVLARALLDGCVDLGHFEGERFRDPAVQATMALVRMQALDDATLARAGDFYAEVAVTLKDGRKLAQSIARPTGHVPGVPLDTALMRAKVERCIGGHLNARERADFFAVIECCELLPSVRALTASLAGARLETQP